MLVSCQLGQARTQRERSELDRHVLARALSGVPSMMQGV